MEYCGCGKLTFFEHLKKTSKSKNNINVRTFSRKKGYSELILWFVKAKEQSLIVLSKRLY